MMQVLKNGIPMHNPAAEVKYKKLNGKVEKKKRRNGTYMEMVKGDGEWAHVPFPSKDYTRLVKEGYTEVSRWVV